MVDSGGKASPFFKRTPKSRCNNSLEMVQVFSRIAWHWRDEIEASWELEAKALGLKELPEHEKGIPPELYDHPIRYVFDRLHQWTGIRKDYLELAAWNFNSSFGLMKRKKFDGSALPDLTWIFPKLTALDQSGHTRRIVEELIDRFPSFATDTRLHQLMENADPSPRGHANARYRGNKKKLSSKPGRKQNKVRQFAARLIDEKRVSINGGTKWKALVTDAIADGILPKSTTPEALRSAVVRERASKSGRNRRS